MRKPIGVVLLLALLAACTPPRAPAPLPADGAAAVPGDEDAAAPALPSPAAREETALRLELGTLNRVNRVVWPILRANAARCAEADLARPTLGIAIVNRASFAPGRRQLAETRLGIGLEPRVLVVPDGTPAARAGVHEGDTILGVGPAAVAADDSAPAEALRLIAQAAPHAVALRVRRDGRALTLSVEPVAACRFALATDDAAEIRAVTTQDVTTVSLGLFRFAARDDDLALLLAHQIAYRLVDRRGDDRFPDGTPRRFTWVADPASEREADRLALRMAAAAGYAVDDAAALWQRIRDATPNPTRQSLIAMHPVTDARLADLRAAAPHSAAR